MVGLHGLLNILLHHILRNDRHRRMRGTIQSHNRGRLCRWLLNLLLHLLDNLGGLLHMLNILLHAWVLLWHTLHLHRLLGLWHALYLHLLLGYRHSNILSHYLGLRWRLLLNLLLIGRL